MLSITISLQLLTKPNLTFHFHIEHFCDFLKNRFKVSSFLRSTDKTGTEDVIFSLDSNESVGSNSVPTKILKLLKNDISSQLSDMFHIFLFWCITFHTKNCKGIPCTKKGFYARFLKLSPNFTSVLC